MTQQVEHGWVILDRRGRIWGRDQFFTNEDGAHSTVARCNLDGHEVRAAKLVSHFRRTSTTTGRVVSEIIVEPPK